MAAQSLGLGMSAPTEGEREHYMMEARERMIKLAGTLEPRTMGVATFEGESLVLMLPLDCGGLYGGNRHVPQRTPWRFWCPWVEVATKHAPRTSIIPIGDTDVDDPMRVDDVTG